MLLMVYTASPGRRESLEEELKRISQQKSNGTQTGDPLFISQNLPRNELSEDYLAEKERLLDLRKQISNLELQLKRKSAEIQDRMTSTSYKCSLDLEKNGLPPSVDLAGNHSKLLPRNASLEYGRGLLGEISYKLQECRELLHQREGRRRSEKF